MRFTPNLVIGLVITLLGALFLLERLGALEARNLLHYWPVLLTLFGVSIMVQALRGDEGRAPADRGRPLVGPGFVIIWVIVWLAVSGSSDRRFVASGASGDPELTLVGVMSQDARTSVATAFQGAQMTSVMGRTRLDLRQATIARGGEATVEVFGLMGSVEVIVPEAWTVDVQTTAIMGGVRDRRGEAAGGDERTLRERRRAARDDFGDRVLPPAAPPAPATTAAPSASRLVLRGLVMAGGLIIRS